MLRPFDSEVPAVPAPIPIPLATWRRPSGQDGLVKVLRSRGRFDKASSARRQRRTRPDRLSVHAAAGMAVKHINELA